MTSPKRPPEIWVFNPIGADEAAALAETITNRVNLYENEELARLLITLLAGVAANCACTGACNVENVVWHALFQFFKATQTFNDTFFAYVVHDLKIARDHRTERDTPEQGKEGLR